jgi:hypothetical protein
MKTKISTSAAEQIEQGLDPETIARLDEYRRVLDSDGEWSLEISREDWELMLELQDREIEQRRRARHQ